MRHQRHARGHHPDAGRLHRRPPAGQHDVVAPGVGPHPGLEVDDAAVDRAGDHPGVHLGPGGPQHRGDQVEVGRGQAQRVDPVRREVVDGLQRREPRTGRRTGHVPRRGRPAQVVEPAAGGPGELAGADPLRDVVVAVDRPARRCPGGDPAGHGRGRHRPVPAAALVRREGTVHRLPPAGRGQDRELVRQPARPQPAEQRRVLRARRDRLLPVVRQAAVDAELVAEVEAAVPVERVVPVVGVRVDVHRRRDPVAAGAQLVLGHRRAADADRVGHRGRPGVPVGGGDVGLQAAGDLDAVVDRAGAGRVGRLPGGCRRGRRGRRGRCRGGGGGRVAAGADGGDQRRDDHPGGGQP